MKEERETQPPAGAELQWLFGQKMQHEGFNTCWALTLCDTTKALAFILTFAITLLLSLAFSLPLP
jgi:hypothetical protein